MSVEGIPPSGTVPKIPGPYDYLLNRNIPEATLPEDQLRGFLDGINGYLAELDALDLPPEYLEGINKVLDDQVSLAFGEKVSQHPGESETEGPAAGAPPILCVNPLPPNQHPPSTGHVPAVGKPPAAMPADLWESCVASGKKTGVDPYILAAQMEKESRYGKALVGSPSAGDGLMQVEPSTRAAYASRFQAAMGHAYDHASKDDQVALAAVILADKGGTGANMLQKYNGGDNWKPGTCDSYGRVIKADEYASTVLARAQVLRGSA
ncbi:MAG: peptidoglycan lytic transglycosylase, Glycoside Hydrolase Family 23-like protein [Fibrobacteres bacterium]|nr:peptidoglycan lytic transglycosylase, Glycoside Hydrolase Family 23-like protein [Fibrobacterota bacterium]